MKVDREVMAAARVDRSLDRVLERRLRDLTDGRRLLLQALAALKLEPVGKRLVWSTAQYRARALARTALRDALGIKD